MAGLSDEERAELERLRAEKAARELEQAQRSELEQLRRERREAELDRAAAERREAAREYMEPDEDLHMPVAQKIVLLVLAVVIALFVVNVVGGGMISN